ncbi:hypothetical protein AGRI_04727 [Alishewanella agri BL06]|uniref:Capsule assembly protein Wzi n=1 Tax=Alishewanella agri BL06 TaxID=1195246 RepID=I9P346_9ALTE|nr:capsule assembly Wzi family protein [Alishewanella agri]EIW89377.1 hypothetical protein AGRI_04727 [Alishewanella agri BL06]
MRVLSKAVLATLGLSLAPGLQATPWVKTDDQFLQQSIHLLANSGHINTPVNTWPIMWQPILEDLAAIDTQLLNDAQLHAYLRIKSAAAFAKQDQIKSLAVAASENAQGQRSFGNQYQQEAMISVGAELKDNNWTTGIYKQFNHNAYDANSFSSNDSSWDGSYGAYTAGNWVMMAAIHQQWWGPAIHSSFNFNNQQRPAKSLQISRLNPNLPLHQRLSSLGAVQFNLQYGEFAGTAPTRHATYLASRIGLKPLADLEVGITGRKLQPKLDQQSMQEPFFDQLPTENITTLGLDLRYHLNIQTALYAEFSSQRSEKKATGWLTGAQYHLGNQFVLLRFFTEYQYISADYSQWLFIQPGQLQAALKSEWVAGVQITTPSGESGYLKFSKGTSQQNVALQEQLVDPAAIQAGYQRPLLKGLVSIDYQLQRAKQESGSTEFDHAVGARWEWRW